MDTLSRLNESLAGRYLLDREIGAGGMATVYLAADVRHGRQVAVKVLRPEWAATIGADRFLREIETAAALNHPHILPLYDSGAVGEILFYVMPYVRGETLRQRLARELQLPLDDALSITRQVATALAFAHAAGVVHRDIKPENILLHEGEAMLADFGIALASRASPGRLTEIGLLVGTPEYMSPEQSVAEPTLDARSDLYSLGCVLYEMLTGETPHAAPTVQALLARRLGSPAPSVLRLRGAVPAAVDRALARVLERDAAARFASAAEFADALGDGGRATPAVPSVAVLPFRNLSADPDNEYFADGITEDVIAQLCKIQSLRVISRTSVMRFKERDQGLREVGAALDASALLEGSVRRVADRVRIVAQLIDVDSDAHLWGETYDRQLTDIFAIQSDVALHIAAALRAELTKDESTRIAREPTRDLEAYQLYLQGRQSFLRFTEEGFRMAVEYFERAIARDGNYAMAHVGLALGFTELGETGAIVPEDAYRRAKDAAVRALALDSDLGEAHSVLAYLRYVSDFDWTGAEREFKRSLELTPGSAETYDLYGRLCAAMGRHDEAIAMQRRAQALDPLVSKIDLATAYLRAGRNEEALHEAERAIRLDPGYARAHATVGWARARMGDYDGGLAALEKAVALAPEDTGWLAQLGQMSAMAGKLDRAGDVLTQLEELARQTYVSPYHLAYVHTGLGDADRAIDLLESAYANRAGAIYGVKGSFLFTDLHGNPRFTALLRKMNLA